MAEQVDLTGPEPDAWVSAALRVEASMPSLVWERLDAALRDESDARARLGVTDGIATVTELASRRRRPSLLTGMVAAAVVLVAAGLVLPFVRDSGGSADSIVAGEAPMALPGAIEDAAPKSAGSAPARQVVASGIDYSAGTLPTDVRQVVDTIGASSARLMSDVQPDPSMTEGVEGFTSSLPLLKACLTWLTGSDKLQALFVDRASFEGSPAAVVVVPASGAVSILQSLEVWIVTLDCTQDDSSILGHETVSLAAN
ncbi:MAG: hypothetical protein ACOYO9_00160 [Candidatus Nanopelagicales bacterium]